MVAQYLMNFDGKQQNLVSLKFYQIVSAYSESLLASSDAIMGIKPIMTAIKTLQQGDNEKC